MKKYVIMLLSLLTVVMAVPAEAQQGYNPFTDPAVGVRYPSMWGGDVSNITSQKSLTAAVEPKNISVLLKPTADSQQSVHTIKICVFPNTVQACSYMFSEIVTNVKSLKGMAFGSDLTGWPDEVKGIFPGLKKSFTLTPNYLQVMVNGPVATDRGAWYAVTATNHVIWMNSDQVKYDPTSTIFGARGVYTAGTDKGLAYFGGFQRSVASIVSGKLQIRVYSNCVSAGVPGFCIPQVKTSPLCELGSRSNDTDENVCLIPTVTVNPYPKTQADWNVNWAKKGLFTIARPARALKQEVIWTYFKTPLPVGDRWLDVGKVGTIGNVLKKLTSPVNSEVVLATNGFFFPDNGNSLRVDMTAKTLTFDFGLKQQPSPALFLGNTAGGNMLSMLSDLCGWTVSACKQPIVEDATTHHWKAVIPLQIDGLGTVIHETKFTLRLEGGAGNMPSDNGSIFTYLAGKISGVGLTSDNNLYLTQ